MKKTRGKTIFRKVRRFFWSKKASIREKKKSESERETERQRDLHPNVTNQSRVAHDEYEEQKDKK